MPDKPTVTERARDDLKAALAELRTSEGWTRWLRARARMHTYSLRNQLLIFTQRRDATLVRGRRQWINDFNRTVNKGAQAIWILAPRTKKIENDKGEEETKVYFKGVRVYDYADTSQIPDLPEIPITGPRQPIAGDSHIDWIGPLVAHADDLGFSVSWQTISGEAQGYCDSEGNEIVISDLLPVNGQVRTLVHELAHAHAIGYADYGRQRAEVMCDAITFLVCDQIGLDVRADAVPYIAGWSEDAEEIIDEQAKMIDTVTRAIAGCRNDEAPVPPDTEAPSDARESIRGAHQHPVEA